MGALPRLRELTLDYAYCETYAPLARLIGLTSLAIDGSLAMLPAELSCLTSLRSLAIEVDEAPEELDWGPLPAALPHLQRLTHLCIGRVVSLTQPPAVLTCLTGLRSLRWAPFQTAPGAALPPGAWLAGVTRLEARCELLAASLPTLAAASLLQELLVAHEYPGPPNGSAVERVARWAVGAPSLRHLFFCGAPQLPSMGWQALLRLQAQRPELCINDGAVHPKRQEPFRDE